MFTLHLADQEGLDAQFVLPCPVLALDLALRAGRAGISWRALAGAPARALTLWELRRIAAEAATGEPGRAEHLEQVLRAESRAAAASLN